MEETYKDSKKYRLAKKRVDELKGFYWHLAIYLIVNTFITANKVIRNYYNGETWSEAFLDFSTFAIWLFWGIGIVFHALNVFGYPLILGKDWEERKIKKIMEEEEKQIKRFKK